MKAVEFVKKFGWGEARKIVEYRDNHADRTHVFKFNKSCVDKGVITGGAYLYTKSYNDYSVSVGDLKTLVEAKELVDLYGTAEEAEDFLPMLRLDSKDELQEAINLVESVGNA